MGSLIWMLGDWLVGQSGTQERQLRRMGVSEVAQSGLPLRHARYSSLPMLRQKIQHFSFIPQIALFLEQAGVDMTVSVFLMVSGCCLLGAFFLSGLLTNLVIVRTLSALIAILVPWAIVCSKRRARFRRLTTQLPDAIRLMTSALRAGLGLDSGLQIVVNELSEPIRSEFLKLLNETHLYGDIKHALTRFAHRLPLSDMRLFASSACLHRDIGGNFAILLDRLERTVRDRLQLNRELKTLTAESRMTGWIVGLLPVVVGVGILFMNPSYFNVLLTHPSGRLLLGTGAGLELTGFLLIRWLTTPRIN